MITVDFRIEGTQRVLENMRKMLREISEAVVVGLYAQAERVMDNAVQRAPKDTGALRESAFISRPIQVGQTIFLYMGFGADHAAQVHEDTGRAFRVGEAKFLEKAVMQLAKGSLHKIVRRAQRAAQQGERWSRGRYPTEAS